MSMSSACRRATRAVLMTGSVLCGAPSGAATLDWVNLAAGDWFEPANWSGNAVPVAGDTAQVNNGGTVEATGAAAPTADRLHVGVGAGTVSGTVTTTTAGLALAQVNNVLEVGRATDAGARARGPLAVGGSVVGNAATTAIGEVFIGAATGDDAQGEGTVSVAGDMAATWGVVGLLGPGSGHTATGSLTVGGDLGGPASVGAGNMGTTAGPKAA